LFDKREGETGERDIHQGCHIGKADVAMVAK
jgi:hypothetical protein